MTLTNIVHSDPHVCGICLDEMDTDSMHILTKCRCSFCRNCLCKYFQFMIDNGHLRIYCPSFKCMLGNEVDQQEIESLISKSHHEKYQVLLNNKVRDEYLSKNQSKIRCPFCDQIFDVNVEQRGDNSTNNNNPDTSETETIPILSKKEIPSSAVKCPNCLESFCANCHLRLINTTIPTGHNCNDLNDSVLNQYDIKKCPNCNYLIQREGGCAQISCRNCSHVFCWHCLKSLDNDFLLFHYDSGPCKNRLGHSRISIFFNRAQTISICLGISILMILASPVILMTLPCILTSRCRMCCRPRRNDQSQV
ncbi:hypothetical protein BLOT_005171 [Blomia tropicalis]|nr:hypothetical protein BLOT_005171 [Blomia tropicalis]